MVYHHRRCISSAVGCIFFRNDDIQGFRLGDIQNFVLMIYTPLAWLGRYSSNPNKNWRKYLFYRCFRRKIRQVSTCRIFLSIAKAMVYHHALACISSPKVYIISRRLYPLSQWWYTTASRWWYTMLRINDIHGSAVIRSTRVQIHRLKIQNIFFIAPSQESRQVNACRFFYVKNTSPSFSFCNKTPDRLYDKLGVFYY